MFAKLFILFAIMPIIEIALLLEVGEIIGGWTTLGIVILTAFIGAKLVREQGIQTLHSLRTQTASGQLPAQTLVEGLMLLIAGVLLVTPGFVTDAIGFLLTIPVTRKPIALAVYAQIKDKLVVQSNMQGGFHSQQGFHQQDFQHHDFHQKRQHDLGANPFDRQPKKGSNPSQQGDIIDGEFERKD
ncbi:membrane protein FxsA [Saccharobesus litoralis]|uniref:Membrane protein FxsA n=1 Tax=Saccharobesus litoralis TaxID=2172099 RepID=A0A2S0VNC6_9ALTE|nr:FxsA family protein [Saccharobesus litoralis]AWB65728.1 membrane protein FxsA [Saccharobesus litoralis]